MWLFLNYFTLLTMLLDSEHFLFYVCMCVCELHVHVCERPEVNNLWCCSLGTVHFALFLAHFRDRVSQCPEAHQLGLDQLDTKPLESTCLCHPNAEITRPAISSSFFKTWFLGVLSSYAYMASSLPTEYHRSPAQLTPCWKHHADLRTLNVGPNTC